MKYIHSIILSILLFLLCGCSMFDTAQPSPDHLTVPIGKNWQIIEEPPKLSDERGRLPFQTEQSLQPEGERTESPVKDRTIKTPL